MGETHQGLPGQLPSLGLRQKRKEKRKIPKVFSTSHSLENPS